ncbi:unnamed protein product, partial [Phaeothamnion confervicola]
VDSKGVDERTVALLAERGITAFTPVQTASYDPILAGRDIIARSRTGTGKTIAFGLPVIQRLAREDREAHEAAGGAPGSVIRRASGRGPRMLIICPTRELARQVSEELVLLARPHGLAVDCFHGGVAYGPQEGALRRGLDVLVATPGRVIDHLERGSLRVAGVRHAVLDEADEMLNMGFADDIERVFGFVDIPKCQVMLFSATVPDWVRRISAKYLKDALSIDAVGNDHNQLATTVKHVAIGVPSRERAHMLEDVITVFGGGSRAMVFAQRK